MAVGTVLEDFEDGLFNFNFSGNWHRSTGGNTGYCLRSNVIGNSQATELTLTLDFIEAGTISFDRKVSSESCCDPFDFYIDGVSQWSIKGEHAWANVSYNITTGTHTFKWRYAKDGSATGGSDAAFIDNLSISGIDTSNAGKSNFIEENFEDDTLNFTMKTGSNWLRDTVITPKEGLAYYRSADIGNGGNSYFEFDVTPEVFGELHLWFRVSSEACCDKIRVYINGAQVYELGAAMANGTWYELIRAVQAGTNTIKIAFTKDGSADGGEDRAYVDLLKVTGFGGLPQPKNFAASLIGTNDVRLTWDKVVEATAYEIYQDGALIHTTIDNTILSYDVMNLSYNKSYTFGIKSINTTNATSSYMNSVSITTDPSMNADMVYPLDGATINTLSPVIEATYKNEVAEKGRVQIDVDISRNFNTSYLRKNYTTDNIAYLKSVSIVKGTANSNYPVSRIVDNDTNTDNYAEVGPDATDGESIIQVDLGKVFYLDRIELWHYYKDGRTYYGKKTEVSEDGATWVTVYDETVDGTYAESSSGKTISVLKNARYIRDKLDGSTANAGNHWVELKAYQGKQYLLDPTMKESFSIDLPAGVGSYYIRTIAESVSGVGKAEITGFTVEVPEGQQSLSSHTHLTIKDIDTQNRALSLNEHLIILDQPTGHDSIAFHEEVIAYVGSLRRRAVFFI